mgnify:CR=1 FL=1
MIGGRGFQVSCQPGEEHFLRTAAQMLDAEAAPIVTQMGRLPEARLLLMAGLMLADRLEGRPVRQASATSSRALTAMTSAVMIWSAW